MKRCVKPSTIYTVKLYDRWSRQEKERGVVIVYVSMNENTQKMAEEASRALARAGVERIRLQNNSHLSNVLTDVCRLKGLILGSCTYNTRLFPPMEKLVHGRNVAAALKVQSLIFLIK
jgi:flavorubredoxin